MSSISDPRVRFIIDLGRALHSYGIPAHRLEDALGNAAARLGIKAEFFSGPTSLISSFGETGKQHTALSRVQPGNIQLDKLVELDEVVEDLYRGDLLVEEAEQRLHTIDTAPRRYGPVLTTCAFATTSAAVSGFFGVGMTEVWVAGGLGLLTGLMALLADRFVTMGRLFEFLVAGIVTIIALGYSKLVTPLASHEVIIASLIVLLPGLSLTQALNELATGHLVSGTARLSGTFMTFLKLGLGVAIGSKIVSFVPGVLTDVPPTGVPAWALWISLLVAPLSLVVLFQARRRELPWIIVGALCAYWGGHLGVALLEPGIGAAVGALFAGLVANLFARLKRRPAIVMIVPSILLLVPGSIGYLSVSQMLADDVTAGIGTAFNAMIVGVALVAGLLLSNVILPPRNAL